MGSTISAPYKAMQMTNANMSREFSYGPAASRGVNTGAPAGPSTRKNRRNETNAVGAMAGGKRRKSRRNNRKTTQRKRR